MPNSLRKKDAEENQKDAKEPAKQRDLLPSERMPAWLTGDAMRLLLQGVLLY